MTTTVGETTECETLYAKARANEDRYDTELARQFGNIGARWSSGTSEYDLQTMFAYVDFIRSTAELAGYTRGYRDAQKEENA